MSRFGSPHETKVRAKRIPLGTTVLVESRTLGTPISYNLSTENVSKTGLLVGAGRYKRVPFLVNTLLEMTIDPQAIVFDKPVCCLGKVVRMESDPPPDRQYGVHIIQMEQPDLAVWESVIRGLERQISVSVQVFALPA